jgi:hypothetical protein
MNESLEKILIEALDLLEQGLGVEDVAAHFPDQASELRPILMTAAALSNLATQPALTAKQSSRQAFLAAAERTAAREARPAGVTGNWLRRLMAPALVLLAVIFLAGAGFVGAAGSAVPGDALYEAKRFVEETRLRFTSDPEAAAALRERFERERVGEIERLLAQGRAADVAFTGIVESMAGDRWLVAGVPVDVSAAAIDGAPDVGALVGVDGRTGDGMVQAQRVTILIGFAPETPDEPLPAPTRTPRLATDNENDNGDDDNANNNYNDNSDDDSGSGQQPPASLTPRPTVASPTPTSTITPPPTAPPPTAPAPTATPDDGDDNDNGGDDNANDNGGDDNANDNGGDDNGGDDNANDNGGDDNTNDNGGDDNANDNDDGSGGDDNANDNSDDDNANDNGGDNGNDNGGDDDANDNGGDDNANDNDDNSGSGGDNDNDNNSGSGGDNDNGGDDNDNDDNSGGGDDNDNGD